MSKLYVNCCKVRRIGKGAFNVFVFIKSGTIQNDFGSISFCLNLSSGFSNGFSEGFSWGFGIGSGLIDWLLSWLLFDYLKFIFE